MLVMSYGCYRISISREKELNLTVQFFPTFKDEILPSYPPLKYAVQKSRMEQFRRRVQTLENTCLLQCSFSKVPVLFLKIILMEYDQNTHKKYPECMINQFGAVWESTTLSPGLGCSKTALFSRKTALRDFIWCFRH